MIYHLKLENFTAFKSLNVQFSKGINIFIGANGTGKTHILKVIYASCDITKTRDNFAEKINRVFMPSNNHLGRLVKRKNVSKKGSVVVVSRKEENFYSRIRLTFSNQTKDPKSARITRKNDWRLIPIESIFIPVKETLSNAPGFRSLYISREVSFEEVYIDIIDRSLLPVKRGPIDKKRKDILSHLQKIMEGKVSIKNEEFFLRNKQGNLEFMLLSEGMRKLALLWILIQNGVLMKGSVLCWDEPEANLNPKMMKNIVEILLYLQRIGVQIFLATHNYVFLKEFDLQMKKYDQVMFHSLFFDKETNEIQLHSTDKYMEIHPNTIADAFDDLYDREIKRTMEGS
ncbi:MAG: AAA family ATPase [Candidatus Omnitrophota bacterium]